MSYLATDFKVIKKSSMNSNINFADLSIEIVSSPDAN